MQAVNDRHETRPGPTAPGPLGLLIRVVLGAAAVYALVELVTNWDAFRDRNLIESDFWLITVFTLCLLADVFNIGLRRRWGAWPIVVFLAGAAAIGVAGYLAAGEVWTTALAAWVYAGDLLVFGALTMSFPVAIATRTPGCELNALPRLVARWRGTADAETRRCLLGVDLLDRQPMRLSRLGSTGYQRRWWALAVLCLSLVVLAMDNTILNVTLPTLARDLGATGSQLQWMVDAYILVFAGLLLTMGAAGDRFGRKLALSVGLLVFVAASAASAFAGSPEVLIASRAAMGIGAALIMPSTLSITTNIFPPKERGRAIGVWAGVAGLGVVLGPVIGGWLLEHFWWGSVFLVNVPVVALAILVGWPLVPESRDPGATPLDPIGAALSITGLVALVYGIIQAPEKGWTDPLTLLAFGLAAAVAVAFIWWERRVQHPMLPMEFFRDPRFSAASGAIAMAFFALFGSVFLLTQHLQFVLGYTPLQTGVRVLPVAALIVAAPLAARLTERIGTKLVVAAGLLLVAGALWLLSTVELGDGYGLVAAALALLGTGMGFTVAPATESIMGSVPLARAGVGSAMNDTTRQVGGALGVAVLGSILAASYGAAIQPALRDAPPQVAQTAGDSIGAAATIATRLGPHGQGLLEAARSAFLQGMGDAVQVGAGVAALAALLVLLFLPARATAGTEGSSAPEVQIETAEVQGQPHR